jgi:hypothetical protein
MYVTLLETCATLGVGGLVLVQVEVEELLPVRREEEEEEDTLVDDEEVVTNGVDDVVDATEVFDDDDDDDVVDLLLPGTRAIYPATATMTITTITTIAKTAVLIARLKLRLL